MAPDDNKRNRLLWDFKDELWGLLKKEAEKEGRTPPRQLEEILKQRYDIESLSAAERAEALRLAKTKDVNGGDKPVKRPKKATKKTGSKGS